MRVTHISIIHKPLDIRIFRKECRALAAAGYDVHLVVGGAPSEMVDGVHVHSIADADTRPLGSEQLPRLIRAARVALRLRPSLYHLHDPHLIPLGLVLKLWGERVVYDVHEDYPAHARTKHADHHLRAALKALTWSALERIARGMFDAFVCASPLLGAKFPHRTTVVVDNLPLHREFTSQSNGAVRPYPERANKVVYTGSISSIRGFWEIARALELLPAELDCRLRMVGQFRDPKLERAVASGATRRGMELMPHQPYDVVIDELLDARIGLALLHPLPNHTDAFRSNKLFEYMAAGIPVIATDLPRWRELVCGVGCGVVVDSLDPAAIAHAIEYLLMHPAEAEAMGQRGLEAVLSEYNWDAAQGRLLSLYRNLVGAPSPAAAAMLRPAAVP